MCWDRIVASGTKHAILIYLTNSQPLARAMPLTVGIEPHRKMVLSLQSRHSTSHKRGR